jgi:hypothetical protein
MVFGFVASLCFLTTLSAQAPDTLWTRTFGGGSEDQGFEVRETPDGGCAIVGFTKSYGAGDCDVYLLRLDPYGDTLWTRTYGSSMDDRGYGILVLEDGGFMITGFKSCRSSAGMRQVYFIRTNPDGDTLWTRTYGKMDVHDEGHSIDRTQDGGFIVTGKSDGEIYLIRINTSGDSLWAVDCGGDIGRSVIQTSDGGFMIGGQSDGHDQVIVKTDSTGSPLWRKVFGGPQCWGILQTDDDGYALTGRWSNDVSLNRTDSSGNSIWSRFYGGGGTEEGHSIFLSPDLGYVITGYTTSYGAGNEDVYLVRTETLGIEQWSASFGGPDEDLGRHAIQTSNYEYIVVGYTQSFGSGGKDVYVIKTEPSEVLGAWLSRDSSGFPIESFISLEEFESLWLSVMLQNDSETAVEIVHTVEYDTSIFDLTSASLDLSDFPSAPDWAIHSRIQDTVLNDTGKILIYLSNGGIPAYALPEGIHRFASLQFEAVGTGRFTLDTTYVPPSYSEIFYTDTLGVRHEPEWTDCDVVVYAIEPDIGVSPESFTFYVEGSRSVTDVLWVYNWAFNSSLHVDSIVNGSDWLTLDDREFDVGALDSQGVEITVHTSGLLPGVYSDTLRISSNDPDEPVVRVPVALLKDPTDDAWISLDPSGDPMLIELSADTGGTYELHFMLRNNSDTAHSIVFPVSYETRWMDVTSAGFDTTTYPTPSVWSFVIGDTVVNDTGRLSFCAFTTVLDQGIPPGLESRRIGSAAFEASGCGWTSAIDTCHFDGHGSLSYENGSTGEEFVPSWQFVSVGASDSLCGDTNGDCRVTTGDGFYLLNFFGGGPFPVTCWSANGNGDEVLTTGDGFLIF